MDGNRLRPVHRSSQHTPSYAEGAYSNLQRTDLTPTYWVKVLPALSATLILTLDGVPIRREEVTPEYSRGKREELRGLWSSSPHPRSSDS